jgi:hypothetical protein
MTREELIRMGAASGLSFYGMGKDRERFIAHMQRFADMVLARASLSSPGPDSAKVKLFNDRMALTEEALTAMKAIAAADEREACARLAEEWLGPTRDKELYIAAAIRARGQA